MGDILEQKNFSAPIRIYHLAIVFFGSVGHLGISSQLSGFEGNKVPMIIVNTLNTKFTFMTIWYTFALCVHFIAPL